MQNKDIIKGNGTVWKYSLLALFLLVQSFAASHEVNHTDQDLQDETCILCQSNDNTPLDTAPPTSNQLVAATAPVVLPALLPAPSLARTGTVSARAPPIFQ